MMRGFGRRVAAAVLLLLAVTVLGCGGKRAGSITGTVSYKGEKLARGTVTYYTEDEKVAKPGFINPDGTYKVEDVPPGPMKITVFTGPNPSAGLAVGAGGKNGDAPKKSYLDLPTKYIEIPTKYASPRTTPLTYDVKPGAQVKDLDLTD